MKRIVILFVLVAIAGVAGVVRSSVKSVSELRGLVSHRNTADVRQEIRQSYELSPGARVEIAGRFILAGQCGTPYVGRRDEALLPRLRTTDPRRRRRPVEDGRQVPGV